MREEGEEEELGPAILQELRVLNALIYEALAAWLLRNPAPPPPPSPPSLPTDLPGRPILEAAGILEVAKIPKSGEQLERLGLDPQTVNRLMVWRAQNGPI